MTNFIDNLCPNPSFETSLAGYTSVQSAVLTRILTDSAVGRASMQVTTPGTHTGEGFFGPQSVAFGSTGIACVSFAVAGNTGTVQVSAVTNPGGIILSTITVPLTTEWTRYEIDSLTVASGDTLYILVETGSPEALTFKVDAIQYELAATSKGYIDGDQPSCIWTGTRGLSSSFQQYQYPLNLSGGVKAEGTLTVIIPGEVFDVDDLVGDILSGGTLTATVGSPAAAFDDFALFELTDLDPAMTYVGWNNASKNTGQTSYNRNWAEFYPPLDYPASDGTLMWPRAAYGAMGFELVNIPASQAQNLTLMQMEKSPLVGSTGLDQTPGPSAYDTPRSIHLLVKPARLNYCPNPSFETSLSGWTAVASATISRDTTAGISPAAAVTDVATMKVIAASAGQGATVSLTNLIVGDTFIASIWVKASTNLSDLQISAAGVSGGIDGAVPGVALPAGWYQSTVTFVPNASTVALTISPLSVTGSVTANVDTCLVEAGDIVNPYFDANFGADYLWETGGTANLTRSYYYPEYQFNQKVISDILSQHAPVGTTPNIPTYALPPTQ